jgi:Na+/melibiose symporter-like transporter
MPNKKISAFEMRRGQRFYNIFSCFNAVSFICLADSVLILLALKMGCPDYLIAIITSFMYLGNLSIILGKLAMSRMGASNSMGLFWLFRNSFGLLTASAPFFASAISPGVGIAVLVFGAFGFYFSRSAGCLSVQPLLGEITYPEKRGRFIAGTVMLFNITALFILGIMIYALSNGHSVKLFQGILAIGAIAGFISTFFVFNIKESGASRESASKPLKNEILKVFRDPDYRKLLAANAVAFSGIVFIVPISMLALKEGYGISDRIAMFFSMIQFSGGIIISFASRLLSDETGPRPLIILYFCLLGISSVFWVFAPDTYYWFYVFIIFMINGCCFMGIPASLTTYFLAAVDEKERVGFSFIIALVSGIAAGLCGSLIGSQILRLLKYINFETPLDLYKTYFLVILLLIIPGAFIITRLKKLEDWKVTDVLGLFITPRDIRTLLLLNTLERVAEPVKENETIHKLEKLPSGLSEKKLLEYLNSPKFNVRAQVLQAMRLMPEISDDTAKALINELRYGKYTTAYIAVQVLGENNIEAALPELKRCLDSSDNYLKGKAMVSLAKMKHRGAYDKIRNIFIKTTNPRLIIHGAMALAEIGDPEAMTILLNKAVLTLRKSILYEIILAVAEIAGTPNSFYKFLRNYMINEEFSKTFFPEYLETLSGGKMDEVLKEKILLYCEDSIQAREIVESIISITKDRKRKMLTIIKNFLAENPSEKIPRELFFCIICALRKNGFI